MVIMWPDEHGITLSQRQATGHVAPSVVANPPRPATLMAASYSNRTGTSMSFSIPTSDKQKEDLIWAFSKTQPLGGVAASLSQHIWSGYGQIDFSRPFEEVRNPTPVHAKTTLRSGMPASVLVAHMAIGVMVTVFLLPGGLVVPYFMRELITSERWLRVHMTVQGGLSLLFLLIALGTGASFRGGTPSTHRGCSIAMSFFFLLQWLLSMTAHFVTLPDRFQRFANERKLAWVTSRWTHFTIGLLCVVLGWAICWTGFVNEWPQRGHGYSAYGLRVGWGIMFAFWIIVYLVALYFFFPRQRRQAVEEQASVQRAQERYSSSAFEKLNDEVPVTPLPPEPTPQFSPPPSPSQIPMSSSWFRLSQEIPKQVASSVDPHDPRRLSDLHTSGMPTSSSVPRVTSRERLDSVITYEGTLSRKRSEESMQSRFGSWRSSRGSRGSWSSMVSQKEFEESLANGVRSLKNSMNSLKSMRRNSDAPPTAFPFRRGSDSQLHAAQVQNPFEPPSATPSRAATPSRGSALPAPSAYRRNRLESDDHLSIRSRRSHRQRRTSDRSARSLSDFGSRNRKASDASFLGDDSHPDEPPLKMFADKRDQDPFGLNRALSSLFDGSLNFSTDDLSPFRDHSEETGEVEGAKDSNSRRKDDQPDDHRRTLSPASIGGRNDHTSRRETFGQRKDTARDASSTTWSRSGSVVVITSTSGSKQRRSDNSDTTSPPSAGQASSLPPVKGHSVTRESVQDTAAERPPLSNTPRPASPSTSVSAALLATQKHVQSVSTTPARSRSSKIAAPAPRRPFPSTTPTQRGQGSDLRSRRLIDSYSCIPKLDVRTGRTPATPPAAQTSVSAMKAPRTSSVMGIASRSRANTVSSVRSVLSDDSIPPPVPPKD